MEGEGAGDRDALAVAVTLEVEGAAAQQSTGAVLSDGDVGWQPALLLHLVAPPLPLSALRPRRGKGSTNGPAG